MRAWASEPAHPLMAVATRVSVGLVECVSPSHLFPGIYQGFGGQCQLLVQDLATVANRRFYASEPLAPSPVVGR